MPNLKKWVNLSFLFCGFIVWTFFREIFDAVFSAIGFIQPDWPVSPSDVAGILIGLIVFVGLLKWPKANDYLNSVLLEMTKVIWSDRKETVISTGVVSVMVGIATICILLFDTVWSWVAKALLY